MQVGPGERLACSDRPAPERRRCSRPSPGSSSRDGPGSLGRRVLTSTDPPVCAVPPWQRRVGLLRQNPGLFPHLSVQDNLRYARSASQSEAELSSLAAVLGIGDLLSAMPARLSGGQAHRVALGRLLLARCDALLLESPTPD